MNQQMRSDCNTKAYHFNLFFRNQMIDNLLASPFKKIMDITTVKGEATTFNSDLVPAE